MNTEPVNTKVGADASQFVDEMNKAAKAVRNFQTSASSAGTAGADSLDQMAASAARLKAKLLEDIRAADKLAQQAAHAANLNSGGGRNPPSPPKPPKPPSPDYYHYGDDDDYGRFNKTTSRLGKQKAEAMLKTEQKKRKLVLNYQRKKQQEEAKQAAEAEKKRKKYRSTTTSLQKQRQREEAKQAAEAEKKRKKYRSTTISLQKQRQREEAKQEKERVKQEKVRKTQRDKRVRAAEKQKADYQKAVTGGVKRAGKGAAVGILSGLASKNPITGALGGATTGFLVGGPEGALVGLLSGGVAGTVGMGFDLLRRGLDGAVELTKDLVTWTVKLGVEYQQTVATFTAFTGSVEGSEKLVGQLQDIAVNSPLKFSQLTGAAKMVMGYGLSAEQTPAAVARLGMMSGGDENTLRSLALAFAQVSGMGRLQGQELRQFGNVGVGAKDFAETMKIEPYQFYSKMRREGGIDSDVMFKTVNRLTDPGGRFARGNEEQLKTVGGRWNQLVETVETKLGKAGAALFDKLKIGDVLAGATAQLEPTIAQLTTQLTPALEEIFKIGGYVFQPLIDTGKALFVVLTDIWTGQAGKVLLPQTWEEAGIWVLEFGKAIGGLTGGMMDFMRAGDSVVKTLQNIALVGDAINPLSSIHVLAKTVIASNDAEIAKQQGDPGKYFRLLRAPWIEGAQKLENDKKFRNDPWAKFKAAAGGPPSSPAKLTGDDDQSRRAPPRLMKFAERFLKDEESGANMDGMEKFLHGMSKLNDALEWDRKELPKRAARLFPNDPANRQGWMDESRLIPLGGDAKIRYDLYQDLKSSVGSSKNEFKLPEAAMADTVEAVKTQIESSFKPAEDIQTEIRNVLERANAQRERQIKEAEALNKFLKDNPKFVVKPAPKG